jgi:hypothetical protein
MRRAVTERCVSSEAHAKHDEAGCAARFKPFDGSFDIAQAIWVKLIVDTVARPAHFRLLC